MPETVYRKAATVEFWDGYAPWYKLWMEHHNYHSRIPEERLLVSVFTGGTNHRKGR